MGPKTLNFSCILQEISIQVIHGQIPFEKHCSRVGTIGGGCCPDFSQISTLFSTLKLADHGKKSVGVGTVRCAHGNKVCL